MSHRISIHEICKYELESDSWTFTCDIGSDKEAIAREENYQAFLSYRKELKVLAGKFPDKKPKVVTPFYSKGV